MRARILTGLYVIAVASATIWLIAARDRGAAIAAVLAVTIALLVLVPAVYQWLRRHPDESVLVSEARSVRSQVGEKALAERQKLLADSGIPRPADVSFAPPELVVWRSDGDRGTGSLGDITEFYRDLGKGRLLVLGDAGAGKTVLANQLLVGLAQDGASRVPIPLSLPSFDPGPDHTSADPKVLARRLDAWISRNLRDVYGVTQAAARTLVADGWVVPVLDGLDEMDGDSGLPERAASVVRALNHAAGGATLRRVVVTCRTARYEQLTRWEAGPGREPILKDLAVIRLQPLTVDQITTYVSTRFPDPTRPGWAQARWQPVLDHVKASRHGALANSLASPLRLFMTVTGYASSASDPSELTRLSAADLDHHLFGKLIPAVLDQRPLPGGGASLAEVTRWLATLARYLREQQQCGASGSDIELHRLCSLTGNRLPRDLAAAIRCLILTIAVVPMAWVFWSGGTGFQTTVKVVGSVAVVLVAYGGSLLIWLARDEPVDLRRLDLRQLRSPAGRRRLRSAAAEAWIEGLGMPKGGPIFHPLAVLLDGITHRAGPVGRPRALVRQGVACEAFVLLGPGAAVAVIAAVLIRPPTVHFSLLVFGAFLWGMLLFTRRSPWLPYFMACLTLGQRGLLPYRPACFLDWTHDAGLTRMSGISVQFRHRDLQNFLTSAPPEGVPVTPATFP